MLSCCFLLSEASSNMAIQGTILRFIIGVIIFPTSDFWFPLPKDPQKWETTTVSPQELPSTLKTKTCRACFYHVALKSWLFQNWKKHVKTYTVTYVSCWAWWVSLFQMFEVLTWLTFWGWFHGTSRTYVFRWWGKDNRNAHHLRIWLNS